MAEYKTPLLIFALCVVIMLTDLYLASKKKQGIDPTDWRRVRGLFGIGIAVSVGFYFLGKTT